MNRHFSLTHPDLYSNYSLMDNLRLSCCSNYKIALMNELMHISQSISIFKIQLNHRKLCMIPNFRIGMKTLVCKSFFPRVSSSFGSEARFHSRSIHSFGMRCAAPRALYSTNSFKRPLIHIVHLNALIELKENRGVVRSALLSPTFNWYKKKYRFHLRLAGALATNRAKWD